jgi:DNA invertase Pin-like site-specific DNA recombinase
MRALGGGRLSRDKDTSTSKERQYEAIELSAKLRGDRLIHIAFDNDVSGAISPFEREELGPWLTEPAKIAQWDVLIVPKLDRLTRSLFDFADFVKWANVHEKLLISVSEGIDLSTPAGRMVANILVSFAQFERERIGERRAEAAEKLRVLGRMGSGRPKYGYMRKDVSDRIYQNPDTAPIARRFINEIIDGMTQDKVCERLTDEGIPAPYGGPVWRASSLRKILASRALLGELQHNGHSVLDAEGSPIMMTEEPLITLHEWTLLQEALDERRRYWKTSPNFHMMLRIAFCGECDNPFHHQHNGNNDYYRDHGTHSLPGIRTEALEAMTEDLLISNYGKRGIERRARAGKDYTAEIKLTERELSELENQYVAHNVSAERFAKVASRLEARLAQLRQAQEAASSTDWEPTGETVKERWMRSDKAERHTMLRSLGLRVELRRQYRISDHAWRWWLEFVWDSEAHERLARLPG